jgi:hypothetical protein
MDRPLSRGPLSRGLSARGSARATPLSPRLAPVLTLEHAHEIAVPVGVRVLRARPVYLTPPSPCAQLAPSPSVLRPRRRKRTHQRSVSVPPVLRGESRTVGFAQ